MSSSERKKERRKARYERNVQKEKDHKAKAWEDGKLIEPNHNNGPYPKDYCIELGQRLVSIISGYLETTTTAEEFVQKYRLYKNKIRDYILHYNPELPKTAEYTSLKKSLELYWDLEPSEFYGAIKNG